MTKEELILKKNIMMRVRFIYGIKSLPRIFVPKIALLATLVAVAGFFVSMPHVLKNTPSFFEIQNFTHFFVAAFLNTKFTIQVVLLGTLVILGLMVHDIMKVFRVQESALRSV